MSHSDREADGLLIGTPVYFASPNGTLLSLLDRLFYSNLHTDWSMKVGAAVSIARRGGSTATMLWWYQPLIGLIYSLSSALCRTWLRPDPLLTLLR